MNTLDVLTRARAEVDKGWCQQMAVDYNGNVCPLGAVEIAIGASKFTRTFVAIYDTSGARLALTKALPAGYSSVPQFNDDPQTTKADVLALFDRAINAEAVRVTPDPAHTYRVAA